MAAAAPPSAPDAPLKTIIMMGSARSEAPMWGGPERLGDRVLAWVQANLEARFKAEVGPAHELQIFDARHYDMMNNPNYFKVPADVPVRLREAQEAIEACDCILIVTPEYNHTLPHGLTNMMNHFGASRYAYKPSAGITYSMTEWGGVRAGVALRSYTAELGCLNVSYQLAIANASKVLDDDGLATAPGVDDMLVPKLNKLMDQLDFWALAARAQRAKGV